MKRLYAFAAMLLLAASMTGCVAVNPSGGGVRVHGEGPLVEKTFTVSDFNSVEIDADLELIYQNGSSDTVRVELQENLLEHLHVNVQDGMLTVDSDHRFGYKTNSMRGKIYISKPTLKLMRLNGNVLLNKSDTIAGDSFTLEISGACEGGLNLDVGKLSVISSGACDLVLTGVADNASVIISGAGKIDALELQTKAADMSVSGAGDITISCSDRLDAQINGAGSVRYKGSPEVSWGTSGAGAISKISE